MSAASACASGVAPGPSGRSKQHVVAAWVAVYVHGGGGDCRASACAAQQLKTTEVAVL